MELRVLRYFLETAREGSMTRAAERLHVTQPTLSKQIKELEEELGKKLFIRKSTSVVLTDEGMILRKRAEDLISIADKIENEFQSMNDITGGRVSVGCAESCLIRYLAQAIGRLNANYPGIQYSITSGGTEQVAERLNNGVLDLAIIVEPPDLSRYNYLEIPEQDVWGVYMRKDCPLTEKEYVTVDDLIGYPLFCSEQSQQKDLPRWCGERVSELYFLASFNLSTNSFHFTREGLGLTLSFKDMIDTKSEEDLVFRPLYPTLQNKMYVIWKKYQVFTPAANLLLEELKKLNESG